MNNTPNETDGPDGSPGRSNWFTTTHWSLVLNARNGDSSQAAVALEKLCLDYWYPLFVYVRSCGLDQESAKDATQGFFAKFLEKNYLDDVQREKGRFRSFLLASMKHFLSDERDKARAQKRGGGQTLIPLDDTMGEERFHLEPKDEQDPEKLYERRWALTLLDCAQSRLEAEFSKPDRVELYARLKASGASETGAATYAKIAAELGLTETSVKSFVFRMQRRHRELVREEVANTVQSATEIDEELRYLITVISR